MASCSKLPEEAGYQLLLTTDKNISYQQNLTIGNQQWPDVQLPIQSILEAVNAATPGSFTEGEISHSRPKNRRES